MHNLTITYFELITLTFDPGILKTGVELALRAALTNPVNNEIRTIPNKIHMIQNARASSDLGERSP